MNFRRDHRCDFFERYLAAYFQVPTCASSGIEDYRVQFLQVEVACLDPHRHLPQGSGLSTSIYDVRNEQFVPARVSRLSSQKQQGPY